MPSIIEVRPGEGGADAAEFATELVATITSTVARAGGTCTPTTSSDRIHTLTVDGVDTGLLQRIAGTHRIQRIPRNDTRGRRHTSTATVAVLDTTGPVATTLSDADVTITTYRASGAGGQHRNKNATAVRIRHNATGIIVTSETKSRHQNLELARAELHRRLNAAAEHRAATAVNTQRRTQVDSERSGKTWTWNTQRDQVVDHTTGDTWRIRQFTRGALADTVQSRRCG